MKRENGITCDKKTNLYFVGPLNLDRQTKQANTVMGTELFLNANEFDALDMLAAQEDEPLTFEQLYNAVWGEGDNAYNREAAYEKMLDLAEQVDAAGKGFMWIEHCPQAGYTFRTNWGHNWQTGKKRLDI